MRTRAGKVRAALMAMFVVFVVGLLSGAMVGEAAPYYQEYAARNLLIRGLFKVLDGVTFNTTATINGAIEAPAATVDVVYSAGSTTTNVTCSCGDDDYGVYLEPTLGVTVTGVTNKTASSFDVKYQAEATATGFGAIIHD